MLLWLIIGCEIGFWVFLASGLLIRYFFRRPKLGKMVLLCVPMLDLILLCATAWDLHRGTTAEFAHGLAAVYLGFTVVYGGGMIRWSDERMAYRFAAGKKPEQSPVSGREYALHEWRRWGKGLSAGAIAAALLFAAIVYVDQPERTQALNEWFPTIFWILAIWLALGPIWYSVFKKKIRHQVNQMKFNFDQEISRENTNSVKFDGRKQYFGTADVSPLWVADMDFAAPECVTRALYERISHPVFGYTLYPDSIYQSIIDWCQRRHQWTIEREWIVFAPGVVPSLFAAATAFAKKGEGVIVQSPVYFPFFSAVTTNNRKLINNPLREIHGRYEIDFDHLEHCAQQGARLLMLCTPHNPVGRVWSEAELQQILVIARRYDLTIFSDDIHCDLIYPGITHTMLGRLAQPGDKIVTAIAPNKTFNIPGLGLSALIVPSLAERDAIKQVFESLHVGNYNPLSIAAFEAAYTGGDEWLDELMNYLAVTRDFAVDYITNTMPRIKCCKPEATYLLWLDCRGLDLTDAALRDFFIRRCKVGMNPGTVFGEGGSGFMRMNIGTRRHLISEALASIRAAL